MKCTVKETAPKFTPVELKIECKSQQELLMLVAFASLSENEIINAVTMHSAKELIDKYGVCEVPFDTFKELMAIANRR